MSSKNSLYKNVEVPKKVLVFVLFNSVITFIYLIWAYKYMDNIYILSSVRFLLVWNAILIYYLYKEYPINKTEIDLDNLGKVKGQWGK